MAMPQSQQAMPYFWLVLADNEGLYGANLRVRITVTPHSRNFRATMLVVILSMAWFVG